MLAFPRTDRVATLSGLRSRLNRAAKSSLFALAQRSLWLRAESLVVLSGVLWLYAQYGGGWLLFALLFVVPDLSLLAGVASRALGAAVYNVAHSYVLGVGLALVAFQTADNAFFVALALAWNAHIGFDRLVGLPYPMDADAPQQRGAPQGRFT